MKIIANKELETTFSEIKFGECFRIRGVEEYFMRTSLIVSPTSRIEFNSVNLSDGGFDYFIAEQKVIKVDCELVIK